MLIFLGRHSLPTRAKMNALERHERAGAALYFSVERGKQPALRCVCNLCNGTAALGARKILLGMVLSLFYNVNRCFGTVGHAVAHTAED